MKIEFCKFNHDTIRTRVTCIWVGTLFLILGIQSILDLFNDKIMDVKNVKEYSSLLIIIGFFMIFFSTISFRFRRNSYMTINDDDFL